MQEVISGLAAGQQVVTNALELQNYGGAVMIRGLVDFALNNRFMILAVAILLFVWGAISFHNLPVEAYPDVANNYVEVITQWPGRAAEEVEQQVTVPIEIVRWPASRTCSICAPFRWPAFPTSR